MLQSNKAIERWNIAISKWMIDACIEFNAVTSKFYQQMIDAIDSMDSRYMCSWFYAFHGSLLDKNVEEDKNIVDNYHVTRKVVTVSC